MDLLRCSDRRKYRDFSSRTIFSTYRRPHPLKADKRYENSARRPIDGPLETSPTNSSGYFHRLGLPENKSLFNNVKPNTRNASAQISKSSKLITINFAQ